MNKRSVAVIAGMILLQTAAYADCTKSKAGCTEAKETSSVVNKTAKKKFSVGKAIGKAFGKSNSKEGIKSVASATDQPVGAY